MQWPRFGHLRSTISTINGCRSTESVNESPVCPLFRRFFHCDNDEITAGPFRDDVGGGEVAFLPTVRLFGKFSFRIVNVDGNFRAFDFGPEPEPVFVSFE